jgi:signal transduction histidine kinase
MGIRPLAGQNNGDAPEEILRNWIEAEKVLALYAKTGGGEPALLKAIEGAEEAAMEFRKSDLYRSYDISAFSHEGQVEQVLRFLEGVKTALRRGDMPSAEHYAGEVRGALFEWRRYDTGLLNQIHLSYLYQNIIFIIAILGLLVFLALMQRSARRSDKQARRSAAYTRNVVRAQEAERGRIARELHDSVISELRRLSFLPFAEGGTGAPEFSRGCDDLIRRIREICQNLIPVELSRLGLVEALKNLCEIFETRSGIECRLVVEEGLSLGALSTENQLHCYRLIQEALSNIEKHAAATEASVALRNQLRGRAKSLLMCVTDDGKGFSALPPECPPELPPSTGTAAAETAETPVRGIQSMYDRAAMLRGKLSFESAEGAGVMVRIELPL